MLRRGINQTWNSKELLDHLKISNYQPCNKHEVFRFFHLLYYHTLPKTENNLNIIIRNFFIFKNFNRRYEYLVLGHKETYFVKEHSDSKTGILTMTLSNCLSL